MLNKGIIFIIALTAAMASNMVCADDEVDPTTFYFGGEVSLYNKPSYSTANTTDLNYFKSSNSDSKLVISQNEPGFNLFAGARFNESIGGEIGFGLIQTEKGDAQNNRQATNKINNWYIDFFGFMSIATEVDLVGSVGLGCMTSNANVEGVTFQNKETFNKSTYGYRIGGGVQYNFATNWATRAMIRYQDGNKNFLRNMVSISVGALYTFLS